MRLVSIVVGLALLSAGCAIQPGDPTEEGAQRPDEPSEIVATGSGASTGGVRPTTGQPTGDPSNGQGGRTSGHSSNPTSITVTSTATQPPGDNPNPSPWTTVAPPGFVPDPNLQNSN